MTNLFTSAYFAERFYDLTHFCVFVITLHRKVPESFIMKVAGILVAALLLVISTEGAPKKKEGTEPTFGAKSTIPKPQRNGKVTEFAEGEPGEYIIKLKSGKSFKETSQSIPDKPGRSITKFKKIRTIVVDHMDGSDIQKAKSDPWVDKVEQVVKVKALTSCSSFQTTQKQLDMLDQKMSSAKFDGTLKTLKEIPGEEVVVYVADSGIEPNHKEFRGNAQLVKFDGITKSRLNDTVGHGTSVAALISSETFGISKSAKIVGIRIVDENGYTTNANVVKAINFIVKDHQKREEENGYAKSIAEFAIILPQSSVINSMVKQMTNKGIIVVAAAGNDAKDAKNYSPAGAKTAITVGSIDENSKVSEFSNFGSTVDFYSPGESLNSAWSCSQPTEQCTATSLQQQPNSLSGSSFSSAIAVGVMANFYQSYEGEPLQFADMKRLLQTNALTGTIQFPKEKQSKANNFIAQIIRCDSKAQG